MLFTTNLKLIGIEIYLIHNLFLQYLIHVIKLTFKNSTERNDCINHLKRLFSSYATNSHYMPNRTSVNTSPNPRNYFLSMINDSQNYSSVKNSNFNEIDNYLNTSSDLNTDPLLWWKEHQNEYPVLSSIAKDYLVIQATSVAAEQAFSVAGNTITSIRNRLDPETARTTLCLKSWIENEIGIANINNENYRISSDNNSDSSSGDEYLNSDSNSTDNDNDSNSSDIESNSSDTDSIDSVILV